MSLQIRYTISMLHPETHRFQLTVEVRGWEGAHADLVLPAWTPGSYLIREFARHVEGFRAETLDSAPLPVTRLSKAAWRVETGGERSFRARYEVYANELTVRTSHLDATHGYFNGANVFTYLDGYKEQPVTLRIEAPEGWHASIALPQDDKGHYQAATYDILVDSPGEVGTHRVLHFEALGKPHEVALWGTGNEDEGALRRDLKQVVEGVAEMFGSELPYERYLFIVHLGDRLSGGLEHRDSTTLAVDRWTFEPRSEYEKFLRLAVHEFFHVWNVKRIRPHNLGPFDYTQEVYTPLLWVMEGFTTYYDVILLRRAGFISERRCLDMLAERIGSYRQQPGRLVQSLEESSLTAWTKFYRQDENYINTGISYYVKGGLVALMLDLGIRARTESRKSLDDVLRYLWQEYGRRDVGFTGEQFEQAVTRVGEIEFEPYLRRFLRGVEELPLEEAVERAGLRLDSRAKEGGPRGWTGLLLKSDSGGVVVKNVLRDSPAEAGGLMVGDRLLAIDGYEIRDEKFLTARLREREAGERITLHLFRYGLLMERSIVLGEAPPESVTLRPVENPSPLQRRIYESWLERA